MTTQDERPAAVARNPDVLPPAVRQFSLHLDTPGDPCSDVDLGVIECPPDLARAVPVRRRQFRAGRFCALAALHALAPDRQFRSLPRGEHGAPVWPPGVVGSITHTLDFASAAVARASDVLALGIDTERIVSAERARRVTPAVAWPCELLQGRRAGLDRQEALTLVFSAKEAIFKCLYPLVSQWFHFHDVRIVGVVAGARTFTARVVKTLSPSLEAGRTLQGRFQLQPPWIHTGITLTRPQHETP